MMDRPRRLDFRNVTMVILLGVLAGCQQLSGTVAKVTRKNPVPQPTAATKTLPDKPLSAKQKADVQMAMARSLENQGQMEQAIKIYEEVIKKDPERVAAYQRLAVLHSKRADFKAADRHYQTAIKKAPKNAEVLCDYGYSCYLQRRWKDAEGNLRRAIAVKHDFARAHNNLGLVLARTGREDEALKEFALAGCGEAGSRANLGLALMLQKRWPAAQQQFELALAADPNSKPAKDGLDTLQSLNNKIAAGKRSASGNRDDAHATPTAYVTSQESVNQ